MGNSESTAPKLNCNPEYTDGLQDVKFDLLARPPPSVEDTIWRLKASNAVHCTTQHQAMQQKPEDELAFANYALCSAQVLCPAARELIKKTKDPMSLLDDSKGSNVVQECVSKFAELGEKFENNAHMKKYVDIVMKVPSAQANKVALSAQEEKQAEKLIADSKNSNVTTEQFLKQSGVLLKKFCAEESNALTSCIDQTAAKCKSQEEAAARVAGACAIEQLKVMACTQAAVCHSKIRACVNKYATHPELSKLDRRGRTEACFEDPEAQECLMNVFSKMGMSE